MLTEQRTLFAEQVTQIANAMDERWRDQFGAVDDKYKDLPKRVKKLEDHTGLSTA